jgi:hypothetical protein
MAGKARTIRDTLALTMAAERVLRPGDHLVEVTIGADAVWPYAAGLVLGLDEDGVQSTVAPKRWTLYFGHERAPGRGATVAFYLGTVDDAARGALIANDDGAVLQYRRI